VQRNAPPKSSLLVAARGGRSPDAGSDSDGGGLRSVAALRDPVGARAVASLSLRELNLSNVPPPRPKGFLGRPAKPPPPTVTAAGATALADALALNVCRLTALNLAHQSAGDAGAAALGKALCENASLVTLNLSANGVSDAGAVEVCDGGCASRELWCNCSVFALRV